MTATPAGAAAAATLRAAGLLRRVASLVYETLMVLAILLVASLSFLLVIPDAASGPWRAAFQIYLAGAIGLYLTWFWTHGGQTVAMRAWKIRLVRADGTALDWRRACLRCVLAPPSIGTAGIGVLWALIDRDRQFLHDRLAGTRIVRV